MSLAWYRNSIHNNVMKPKKSCLIPPTNALFHQYTWPRTTFITQTLSIDVTCHHIAPRRWEPTTTFAMDLDFCLRRPLDTLCCNNHRCRRIICLSTLWWRVLPLRTNIKILGSQVPPTSPTLGLPVSTSEEMRWRVITTHSS